MSFLRFVLFTAFCICAVGLNPALADKQTPQPTTAEILAHPEVKGALRAIDAWVEYNRMYNRIPGISVGIVLDQDLIWSKGYGYANREEKRPANANAILSWP